MKKHLPNLMTFLNLLSGVLVIVLAYEYQPKLILYLFVLALIFDYLDGFLARKLQVTSEIGLQLDSLADIISFGLAPFFVLINFYGVSILNFLIFIPLVLAGAYRLARFNTNPTSHNQKNPHYEGFPIPTTAVIIPVIVVFDLPFFIAVSLILILSFLLVSKIKVPKF